MRAVTQFYTKHQAFFTQNGFPDLPQVGVSWRTQWPKVNQAIHALTADARKAFTKTLRSSRVTGTHRSHTSINSDEAVLSRFGGAALIA
jgi:hypothetical protein